MGSDERIQLGVVGLGVRGVGEMRTFLSTSQVEVAAICDNYAF